MSSLKLAVSDVGDKAAVQAKVRTLASLWLNPRRRRRMMMQFVDHAND